MPKDFSLRATGTWFFSECIQAESREEAEKRMLRHIYSEGAAFDAIELDSVEDDD